MVVTIVEPGCLFTKFLSRYKSTYGRQKQTKHDFPLLKKMLHDKQLFNKVPFQSTKFGRKELCVDNINTIGDVYCRTCRNEKCAYLQPLKRLIFTTVKSAKPAATF